jgi:hypothetical protein
VSSRAQVRDGGHDRKKNHPGDEREESDFVRNDAAMRVQDKLLECQRWLFSRAGRRRRRRSDGCDPSANCLPAPPKAASVRPDRVRHAPSPLPVVTAIPASRSAAGEPANRSTLLSSGFKPKGFRS